MSVIYASSQLQIAVHEIYIRTTMIMQFHLNLVWKKDMCEVYFVIIHPTSVTELLQDDAIVKFICKNQEIKI